MGSRSKSRSSNTSGQTQSTMNGLAKGGVSNEKVAGMQQDLANSQWGSITPMFDGLSKMGMAMMGDNPMAALMAKMFGQEQQQPQMPSMADIFQQTQQPQQTQHPQLNINPQMGNLTPEQQAALLNFQRYGGYGRR